MQSPRLVFKLACVSVVAILTACGGSSSRVLVKHRTKRVQVSQAVSAIQPSSAVMSTRTQVALLVAEVSERSGTQAPPPIPGRAGGLPATSATVSIGTAIHAYALEPCGGDLPSCSIVARESGGDYNAVNPTGCGGNGCYGKYQFSGAWAGRLGLPLDLRTATPAQQDAAARELWRNGAGCSNWSC